MLNLGKQCFQIDKSLEHEETLGDTVIINKEKAKVSQKQLSQSSSSSQSMGFLPHEETAQVHSTDHITKGMHAKTTELLLSHTTMTMVR